MKTECETIIRVWVNVEQKIVSFHSVDGHDCIYFQKREHFLSYILGLSEQGFRFM